MEKNTIIILGNGGREHAISQAYEKSPNVNKIIVIPGNDFISCNRRKEVITYPNISIKDFNSILEIAKKENPAIIDVAQDEPISLGAVDFFQSHGFKVFGPTKQASRIEWDKEWSREFMKKYNIPTPKFESFTDEEEAITYAKKLYSENIHKLVYIKATGLCAGKGALKSTSLDEAIKNIKKMQEFGEAGRIFLIEEGLLGEEFSYYAIIDGTHYKIFKSAQDNKTVYNFDEGDQTGGMGVISPAKITKGFEEQIEKEQIERLIQGMINENHPYTGIIYLGGIFHEGKINTIEYNARWGDPECQTVLPSLETDYFELINAAIEQKLDQIEIQQDNKTRICVVGASRGYPIDYSKAKNKRIYNLDKVKQLPDIEIFGAGIKIINNEPHTNGGRLFSIVASGNTVIEAQEKAYAAIAKIKIEGNNLHYRTDIGWRDVERELKN